MSGARSGPGFPVQVLIALAATAAAAAYPLLRYADGPVLQAVLGGAAMSVLNVFMGYAAIEYSFGKSYTHFVQIVLGGMVVRLFVMAGLLLVLIAVFRFHAVALVSSLFAMYVVFLALEVFYIHTKWQDKLRSGERPPENAPL